MCPYNQVNQELHILIFIVPSFILSRLTFIPFHGYLVMVVDGEFELVLWSYSQNPST